MPTSIPESASLEAPEPDDVETMGATEVDGTLAAALPPADAGPPEWSHIQPKMRGFLEIDGRERLSKSWDSIWIPTSSTKEAFVALGDRMNASASTKPQGLILMGAPDTGKSRTMKAFAQTHQPRDDEEAEYREHPAIYLKAPTKPKPTIIYRSILGALGQPILYNPSEEAMELHTLRMMRGCQVGVVMIDELADVKQRIDAQTLEFLRFLKNLINQTERPFALGGTHTLLDLLRQDDQIVSRFDHVVELKPFASEEFGRILRAYERLMPLRKPSAISKDPRAVAFLRDRTQGLIGRLSRFLLAACQIAIEGKQERLTLEVLEKVPDNSIRSYVMGGR
jgi:Cdc6-like AAA superfamily ATPase